MQEYEKIYVIAYVGFWYSDEWYEPSHWGHSMCQLYDNHALALQAWKKLELDFHHTQGYDILSYEGCSYDLASLNLEHLYDEFYQLSDDDVFDLTLKLNRNIYQLVEYPKDLKCYAIWLPAKNTYLIEDETTQYDPSSNIVLKWTCVDEIEDCINTASRQPLFLHGTTEELSESPLLLERLIENDRNLEYNEKSQCLAIIPHQASANSLNALLKKPFFEIQRLTIEEILAIEKQLNHPM